MKFDGSVFVCRFSLLPFDCPSGKVWLCFGSMHIVMIAVKNNNNPSVANGRK